jgi:type IV pilus assembly protein PilA
VSIKSGGVARALRRTLEQYRSRTAEEMDETESGFTLIELMVVLLIMAILLAIAIPTFLGVKGGAQDRSTQSNLTNALVSAKASYANNGSYDTGAGNMVASLAAAEPALSFVAGAATQGSNQVSVKVVDVNDLILVGYSQSGNCFAIGENDGSAALGAAPYIPVGTHYEEWPETTTNTCSGATVTGGTAGAAWQAKYPSGTDAGAP